MPEPTPDLAAIVEEADVWVADYHSQATLSEKGIALKGLGAVLVVDWPTIRAALERTAELEAALREYGRHLAGCASDRKGKCRVCYGTGQIESTDSTDEGWWDCHSCGGTGKAECVCGLEALLAQSAEPSDV